MPVADPRYRSREIILARRAERARKGEDLNDRFLELHYFIDKVIGPWATQARISQFIADDYKRISGTLDTSFQSAVSVSFSPQASLADQAQIGGAFSYLMPIFKVVRPRDPHTAPTDPPLHILINHGVTEQEIVAGQAVVHCYTTVFQENPEANWGNKPVAASRYKDVHQRASGKVEIYDGYDGADGMKTPTGIFFVSVGQPLRALKWMEKYNANGGKAIIRQFSVPAGDYAELAGHAVPEHGAGKGDSINVDVRASSDQFGLRGAQLDRLKERVISGSLVSYTDHKGAATPGVSGEVRMASELRKRLGVPETGLKELEVFLAKNGDFQSSNSFMGIADTLMNLYGFWWRKDEYLSDTLRSMPMQARVAWALKALTSRKIKVDRDVWKLVSEVYGGARSPGAKGVSLIEWRLTA
jgi:hypothetical protein